MTRLTERERQLLFILVVLMMFALTFKFGYMDVTQKSNKVEIENASLNIQLNELNQMIEKKPEYKKEIATWEEKSEDIKNKYGAGNTPEKTIMFVSTLEQISGLSAQQISFGELTPIVVTANTGDTNSTAEETQETTPVEAVGNIYLYCTPVNIGYSSSYSSLKKAIEIIDNCPERMNIESLDASYDMGTGKLTGTILLNMYEMTGTEKIYYPPNFKDMPIGKPLPFGIN